MSVTIAIPFFNAEKFLLDAIRSVFAQTHQDWELILVDDGSTDSSLEIARSVCDPRVRVISDGKNKKLAARLNEITQLASYDYIARMDADDLMAPKRIEVQLKILSQDKNYDLISCGVYSIGNDNTLRGHRGKKEDSYEFSGILTKKQKFLHAGLVARKSWYERNRYDESILVGQDTDLWLRALENADFKAISIPDLLYMYREDGNVSKLKLLRAYDLERNKIAARINPLSSRLVFVAKSYLKAFLVLLLDRFGLLKMLLRLRGTKAPSIDIKNNFDFEMNEILSTKIPGIDNG